MMGNQIRIGMVLTGVFAVAFGFLAGKVSVGTAQAQKQVEHRKILAAEEFRLMDAEGKTRLSIRVNENGQFALSLFDAEGKPKGTFEVSPEGRSSLTLGSEK